MTAVVQIEINCNYNCQVGCMSAFVEFRPLTVGCWSKSQSKRLGRHLTVYLSRYANYGLLDALLYKCTHVAGNNLQFVQIAGTKKQVTNDHKFEHLLI